MSFWGSEKIRAKQSDMGLIKPFSDKYVECCSYELNLGNEAYVTSYTENTKRTFKDGEQIVIEPGQFGILITKEKVKIPIDAIGFISIKASKKFRGLVNVSGFHVDPGFDGYLKFSVYNAGSQNVVLAVNEPIFLIWFSDLENNTLTYHGSHAGVSTITAEDVMRIQGEVASPGQLEKRIQRLEMTYRVMLGVFATIIGGIVLLYLQKADLLNVEKTKITTPINQIDRAR